MSVKKRKAPSKGDWLSLGDASRALGVDPDTLRRWADGGKIDVFVTPGGHRRFPRAAVEALLPSAPQQRQSLAGIAGVDRMAADIGKRVRAEMGEARFAKRLDDEDRAAFREEGRAASATLVRYLNATRKGERDRLLYEIDDLGRAYGRAARARGLSLTQSVEALLFVRGQFSTQLGGLLRRRTVPADRSVVLFEEADRAFDRMLLALIDAHQRRR